MPEILQSSNDQAVSNAAETTNPTASTPPNPIPDSGPGWYGGRRQPFDPRQKSPRMAAALSLIPGLGQVYIGYYQRGFLVAGSITLLIFAANVLPADIAPVFGFSSAFVWLYNIIDAGRMAALYNHAMAGSRALELPADFAMPTTGGSVAGGAALVVFSLIVLSNTALGLPLDWLETWWPVFPLGLGAYLLVKGVQERR